MGATGWKYFVPYEADPAAALERLQADVFAKGLYAPAVTVSRSAFVSALKVCGSDLKPTLETFAARAADPTLPPQMRKKFAELLKQFEGPELAAPVPAKEPATIRELLEARGEEGTHSILDIVRVSDVPEFGAISPLPQSKVIKIFGTGKPTHAQIESKYEEGALQQYVCERWQGIYMVAYRSDLPDELFFAGCSGD